jgi:hypothetical protein
MIGSPVVVPRFSLIGEAELIYLANLCRLIYARYRGSLRLYNFSAKQCKCVEMSYRL